MNGIKIADVYGGAADGSGRNFYFNNVLETNAITNQSVVSRSQIGNNFFLGHIGPYNGGGSLLDYNGTLQFFYWAPVQLTVADLTTLCNT